MNPDAPVPEAELLQEGYSPVQAFTSPAIPVQPDTPLEPRRGRPPRPSLETSKEQLDQAAVALPTAAAIAAAVAGPIAAAVGAALADALRAVLDMKHAGNGVKTDH